MHTHTYTYIQIHTHIHMHTHMHMHTYIVIHMCKHAHTLIHTCIHMYTHTHTHSSSLDFASPFPGDGKAGSGGDGLPHLCLTCQPTAGLDSSFWAKRSPAYPWGCRVLGPQVCWGSGDPKAPGGALVSSLDCGVAALPVSADTSVSAGWSNCPSAHEPPPCVAHTAEPEKPTWAHTRAGSDSPSASREHPPLLPAPTLREPNRKVWGQLGTPCVELLGGEGEEGAQCPSRPPGGARHRCASLPRGLRFGGAGEGPDSRAKPTQAHSREVPLTFLNTGPLSQTHARSTIRSSPAAPGAGVQADAAGKGNTVARGSCPLSRSRGRAACPGPAE
ncbi:uncharacterized protein LOC129405559 [Sorex araneus]|uniref:uncharacterized protein LOC129405559 n=1 Tax=Sorex araneus TaxID=42254 RepID=UPI0024340214|nr:uncharacterized protein LOC129405559 [Sorex araneus]